MSNANRTNDAIIDSASSHATNDANATNDNKATIINNATNNANYQCYQ